MAFLTLLVCGQVNLQTVIFFNLETRLLNCLGSEKSTRHFNPYACCRKMAHIVAHFLNYTVGILGHGKLQTSNSTHLDEAYH